MKKRVLSLFLALTLCLTLLPTAAFAEGETGGSMSGNTTIGGETGGTGGGVLVGENENPGGGFVIPSEQNKTGSAPVAKVGDTEYDTLQEILDDAAEVEITLLRNVDVEEDGLTVYAATTINMDGFSITGDIETYADLALMNGTVKGKVTVDAADGTFTMTAPAGAEAAIDGGLEVKDGSCSVSDAKVGVKGTLFFGGDSLTVSGTEKAVELNAAAEPKGIELYGSATVDGETSVEAVFDEEQGTYTVSGEVAKELTNKQAGGSTPTEPVTLTLNPTSVDVAAGKTATFTVNYNGTGELNAYIQKNGLNTNFAISTPTNNGNGTYTITVKIAEKTPTGDYTLYVHEVGNAFVQAEATINVISTVAKDDKGNYYPTIKDAIEKAPDGSTITVIAAENRISLPDGIYVENQTGITLDLNGHSLDGYSLNVGGLTATSQVRTGNLTVIDSSGGNGAVGVTVRDGGTLVFKPENDNTTLLRLEVYGGTVELYGGKISRDGLGLYHNITLGNLLPGGAGLAYYRGDTQLTLAEAASQTCDLVVKSCSHGGKNGFDNSSATCPYCNAPAVAETALYNGEGNSQQRRFANLQTAIDADRAGGAEFTLLTDVTGDYTIDGTQDTALDLNGHSIKGTVTVKGIKGDYITTTLSNTENTTTASIDKVIAFDGAELAGTGAPAVIGTLTLAEGATWKTILNDTALGYKVLNADGTHKWYAPEDVTGSQLNNVIINSLPITSKTLYLKVGGKNLNGSSPKAERGTTVQLCANCNAKDVTVTFSILKTGETTPITLTEPSYAGGKYTKDYSFDTIGEYTIYFTATKDGYTVTSTPKKLTVTKPNLSNAEITFPNGNEAAFNYVSATGVPTFVVTYNSTELKENVDFVITSGDSTYDVGPCTLTIKAKDNGNYTGRKTAEWTVRPLKVAASVGDIIKTYDGTTALPEGTKITFKSADTYYTGATLRLAKGTDYEVLNARYDSADASQEEKTISFTVKLKNEGYVFEDGTTQKDFTLNGADLGDKTFKINPATIDLSNNRFEQTVFNDLAKTYEIDLKQLLDELLKMQNPAGVEYGNIVYGKPSVNMDSAYYPAGGANIENGKLRLSIKKAASSTQGEEIGTVAVQVETTNYQTFTLTIHVSVQDKLVPVLAEGNTVSATDITYGQALADSKLTVNGTMQDPNTDATVNGTFTWTNGTIKPTAGDYEAEWTFTPDSEEYATVIGKTTVKVAPKSIEGAKVTLEADSFVYDGNEKMPVVKSVVLDNVTLTSLTDYGYIVVKKSNVGIYNFIITGEGNYTGEVKATWQITPREVTPTIEVASCTYTGDALEPNVTVKDGNTVIPTDEYTVEYSDNTNAGTGWVTIKDVAGGNYVIKEKTQDFTITKAIAPTNIQSGTLTITNGLHKTYSLDLSTLLPKLTAPCDYGTITYNKKVDTNLGVGSFITLVNGKTGELTLEANRSGTDEGKFGTITVTVSTSNYQDITLTINVIAKNRITPTGTPTLSKNAITYGDALNTIALSGKLHDDVNNVDVDGTFKWVDGTHIPVVGNGTYAAEWIFEPTDTEKYLTVSGRSNITVEKAQQYGKVSMTGYTYGQAPSTPTLTDRTGDANAQVTYRYSAAGSDSVQTWDIQNPPALNAGTYRMFARIGETSNYYEYNAKYCEFVVAKATPTYTVPTGLTAKYGQTLADVTLPGGWSWMDSSESVGGASTAAKKFMAKFTPTDTDNYNTVENIELEVTVNKADGGSLKTVELEQKYTDASEHTYTPDWSGLPSGQTWSYSSEYSVNTGSNVTLTKQDFAADGSLLTYAISGGKAGDKITITLKASCDNYGDFTITLNIPLTEKDDQKPLTITGDISVIYGEKLTLTTTGGSGTGAVTYRVDTDHSTGEATIDPNTGVLTPVKVGSVSVIATKEGDKDYNDVTSAPFVLMIKPATPTGEPKYTKITTSGKTLKDAVLTTEGSTLNPKDGKLEWVDDEGDVLPGDTRVEANKTYKWRFTPTDTNYTTMTGEIELYHKSSSGGGSGSNSGSYTITVKDAQNGDVTTDRKSASAGTTVTITVKPDSGYVLDDLTVTDSKGNDIKLTGKGGGKYTFTMPSGKATVEASFTPAKSENPFTDVPSGAYYEDAVAWAVNNGITGGTSATTFVPNGVCTRAQAVTFLWRAAGSPAPKRRAMPFTDVPAGSYYYDAVLWAIENGVTKGTSDTTFSPNANCSRGQIVTFLWRSQMSPDAAAANPFTDVVADAYYTSAVLWAVGSGITGGTSATTFSPSANCTRAQIVTFIYRCMK